MAIDRTAFNALTDDSGSGTDGSIWDKAAIEDVLLDPIDAALAAGGDVVGPASSVDDRIATFDGTTGKLLQDGGQTIAQVIAAAGGTPGGSDTQVQYNNAGAFAGDAGLTYDAATDRLTAGAVTLGAANSFINDSSNTGMTVGLTINQGANDDEILALKSSDVAHGVTSRAETDTFFLVKKGHLTNGGVRQDAISAGAYAWFVNGNIATDDTTKATSSAGPFMFDGSKKSGTDYGNLAANNNIAVFRNNGTTRFILDGDGDSHQDVGTAWTNYDAEDDISVLNLLAAYVTRPDDPLRATFAAWLVRSRDTLERLRLVTFNDEDGHHFVNMSRLTMLLVGAMRQTGARLVALEERLMRLEAARG